MKYFFYYLFDVQNIDVCQNSLLSHALELKKYIIIAIFGNWNVKFSVLEMVKILRSSNVLASNLNFFGNFDLDECDELYHQTLMNCAVIWRYSI